MCRAHRCQRGRARWGRAEAQGLGSTASEGQGEAGGRSGLREALSTWGPGWAPPFTDEVAASSVSGVRPGSRSGLLDCPQPTCSRVPRSAAPRRGSDSCLLRVGTGTFPEPRSWGALGGCSCKADQGQPDAAHKKDPSSRPTCVDLGLPSRHRSWTERAGVGLSDRQGSERELRGQVWGGRSWLVTDTGTAAG